MRRLVQDNLKSHHSFRPFHEDPESFLAVLLSILGQAQAQISAVYATGNEVDGKMIVAYEAQTDGSLTLIGEYPTGGNGAILAPFSG